MAKKKQDTGNKFLGSYDTKKDNAKIKQSSSSSNAKTTNKSQSVKNNNQSVNKTQTKVANTNNANRQSSSTKMGGSQYSVKNNNRSISQDRLSTNVEKQKKDNSRMKEQMRNQKSGIEGPKDAITTKASERLNNLTSGTLKQAAGGHLTSLGHDSNESNDFKKKLDQGVADGKITQDEADSAYKSYIKSNKKAAKDQDWKETKLHKTFQKIEKKGIELNAKGDAQVEKGMEGLKGGKKLLASAYTSGVGMMTDMALGPAWAGSMLSRTMGNELNSTRPLVENGVITENEAERYAGLQGLKEVGTEYMFAGVGLAKNLKGAGALAEGLESAKGKALDKLTSKISNKVLKNIAYSGAKGMAGSLEEATEELAGGILEPGITNLAYANNVDKRMNDNFRENLLSNSSDLNTQIDYYVSQGYDRDSIVSAYAEQIKGEENYNELYNSFVDSGMSKKQAAKMTSAMQSYMIANLNGDDKAMAKAEKQMLDKMNDAFSIKSTFSASDTFEAMASAAIMAGATGGVGTANTMVRGADIKKAYSSVSGSNNAASAISKMAMDINDEKMSARAKAMYESAQEGNDLALEQYVELQDAIVNQVQEDATNSMVAQFTGMRMADNQRYFAQPEVYQAEDGSFNYTGEVTNQRAKQIDNQVRDAIKQYSEVTDEEVGSIARAITSIELGFIDAEAVSNLTEGHPVARSVFESVTGTTLPPGNKATRDFLFQRSVSNYENTARLETINTVDAKKGQYDVQYANSLGSNGQKEFQKMSSNIGVENGADYVAYSTAMAKAYDIGRSGGTVEDAMSVASNGYAVSEQDAKAMYEAGVSDSSNYVAGGTVQYDVSDISKIRNSDRETFLAFAQVFNVNIRIVDDFAENGMYNKDTNTITLNFGNNVKTNVGYTIMHEFTHSIEVNFPELYNDFIERFEQRWIENVGEEEANRIIQAKIDQYAKAGYPFPEGKERRYALDEILCDNMGEVLHDPEFMDQIAEENPDLAQTILYTIRDILRKIRQLFATYGGFPSKYNGALLSELDMLKEAENLLVQAMDRAAEINTQEVLDRDSGVRDSVEEGQKYSIGEIIGASGKNYGRGVYFDEESLDTLVGKDRVKAVIKHIRYTLAGKSFPAFDKSNNEHLINVAERNKKFKNEKGKKPLVNKDLMYKYNNDPVKQEAIMLLDEVLAVSEMQRQEKAKHKHGWLDNDATNDWDVWSAYVVDSSGMIWNISLKITNAIDGNKYVYDIDEIKKEEQSRNVGHISSKNNLLSSEEEVKRKRDKIYFDAINSGDMDKVRQMVLDRANERGFTDAVPEQTLSYKTRVGKPPQITKKCYKVFTVDNNGNPSALFVSGVNPLPQNVWLDAQDTWHFKSTKNGKYYVPSTKNPSTKGGKTGKSMPLSDVSAEDIIELEKRGYITRNKKGELPKNVTVLAYRPGWHAGDLPFFPQGGAQHEGSNYENIHRFNQVVFECELAYDVDYTNKGIIQSGKNKGKTSYKDMQEMPENGGYEFATNPLTNATDYGKWYISSSLKINRALTEEECNEFLAEKGFLPQEWQSFETRNESSSSNFTLGPLDLQKLGYEGEQFDAARKTLAPVTYDNEGNIIPLSQRFDETKSDIRWSVSEEEYDDFNDEWDSLEVESELYKPSYEDASTSPNVKFSVGEEGTYLSPQPHSNSGTNPTGNAKISRKNREAILISGKEKLAEVMTNNIKARLNKEGIKGKKATPIIQAEIKRVTDFLDYMNDMFVDMASDDIYTFVGFDDVVNQKINVRRDKDGNITSVAMSAMIKNGEYPVNFDFTTICKKRQAFNKIIEKLSKEKGTDVAMKLTPKELVDINIALRNEGVETACLGCFVEARRYHMQNYTTKVVELWNSLVDEVATEKGIDLSTIDNFNFAEEREITNQEYQDAADTFLDYENTKTDKKSPEKRFRQIIKSSNGKYMKYITAADLVTPTGIEHIKDYSTANKDLLGMFKSAYGVSAPKETVAYTPYNSEVAFLSDSAANHKYLKKIGGIRMQSFSDFLIANTFDYMQMVADMAAKGFPAHAYTKEIAFAKIFGMTGIKINMSIMFDVNNANTWGNAFGIEDEDEKIRIAKKYAGLQFFATMDEVPDSLKDHCKEVTENGVTGYVTYLVSDKARADRHWEQTFNDRLVKNGGNESEARKYANELRKWTQSIDFAEAKALEEADGYSKNCGIIGVGLSNENILMMLEDNYFPYIIPYHASGLPEVVKVLTNLNYATNYEDSQNTRIFVNIKKEDGTDVSLEDLAKRREELGSWQRVYAELNAQETTYEGRTAKDIPILDDNGNPILNKKGEEKTTKELRNDGKPFELAGTGGFDFYGYLEKGMNPKEIAEKYLEYCAKYEMLPVFPQFAGHPNYYKLLIDYNVTDIANDNAPSSQVAVKNNYPGVNVDAGESNYSEVEKIIKAEAKEINRLNEIRDKVVDKIVNDKRFSVDSEGKELSTGQASFFAESKVRDKDGNLLVMYHGTNAKFTVFDLMKGGQTGKAEGFGFYFTDNVDVATTYGTKQMPVYLNIKKPLTDESTINRKDFAKLIKRTIELESERYETDLKDTWISNYVDTYYNSPSIDECCDRVTKQILTWSSDRDAVEEIIAGMGIREYNSYLSEVHNAITEILGFDGVVTSWYGNGVSTEVVLAWRPEQIKSVDNLNPTSDVDIRYSVDSEGNELSPEQTQFFFNSKLRDEEGRLKVMYHGTTKGGFTIFDPMKSDDHRSLFLTDDREVALTYINEDYISKKEKAEYLPKNPKKIKLPSRAGIRLESAKGIKETLALFERHEDLDENEKSIVSENRKYLAELEELGEFNGVLVTYIGDKKQQDPKVISKNDLLQDILNHYNVDLEIETNTGLISPYSTIEYWINSAHHRVEGSRLLERKDILDVIEANTVGADRSAYDIMSHIPDYNTNTKYKSHKTGVYPCYVNLENPLVIDTDGSVWDNIPFGQTVDANDLVKILTMEGVDHSINEYHLDLSEYKKEMQNSGCEYLLVFEKYDEGIISAIPMNNLDTGVISQAIFDYYGIEDKSQGQMSYVDRMCHQISNGRIASSIGSWDIRDTLGIYDEQDTRSVSQYAYNNGYDGVIFNNLIDVGGNNYDYAEDSTVVIAFKPEQIKLVDNKQPTSDPDIRFSIPSQDEVYEYSMNHPDVRYSTDLFLDGDISDEMKARRVKIQEEISIALEQIVHKDLQYTHGKTLNTKSIKNQVAELVRSTMAHSECSNKEKKEAIKFVMEASQVIWNKAGNKRTEDGKLKIKRSDLNEVSRIAMEVARDIIENTRFVDDAIYSDYQNMKDYIRTSRFEVSDRIKSDINYSEYRKNNMGRMVLVNEGNGGSQIDVIWDELKPIIAPFVSGEYDIEEIDTQAEMFLALESALDNTKAYRDAYASEFAQDLERQFATDLMNIVITEGQAWQSFADKKKAYYDERTKQMNARHKEAMRSMKDKYKQQIKEVKAEEREKRNRQRLEFKRREEERKQKAREKRQEQKNHRERMRSWKHIGKNYDWLVKRILKDKKELGANVPEEFRGAIADVLALLDLQTEGSFNLEVKTKAISNPTLAMMKLSDALKEYGKNNGIEDFTNDILGYNLQKLTYAVENRPLRNLTNEELDLVDDLLASIKHIVQEHNQLLVDGRREDITETGDAIINEAKTKIDKYDRRHDKTGIRGNISTLLNESMMTPNAFFRSIGGTMQKMYKTLRKSQDSYITDIKFLRKFYGDLFKPYQKKKKPGSSIEDWQNDKSIKTIKLKSGEEIRMTVAQMMSLYCLSKREQALEHMCSEFGGVGIIMADVTSAKGLDKVLGQKLTNSAMSTTVSYDDIIEIAGMLTEEQKHIADELQKLMNTTLQEWGNETSMKLYGIRLFKEDNYFPIEVDGGYTDSQIGKASGIKGNKISNFGFTKPLVEHPEKPIVIGDIFDIVAEHSNKMALYHSYAVTLTNFNRVFNYRSDEDKKNTVKSALSEAYGSKAIKFIDNLLADINGQAEVRIDGVSSLYNKALANYKKAAIGLNLRVLVQQPTAIVRSLFMIDAKYFSPVLNIRETRDEMHEHCPIAAWKAWGNFQNDYTKNLSDIMFNKDWSRTDVITMKMYGDADDFTWALIWNAVKNEVKAKNPNVEVGSEEFWELCNERASEIFDETQVVDSVFHRSDAMRSTNDATKMLSSFMAEPTKTYNMLRSQIVESYRMWRDGDTTGAVKGLAKITSVLILNAAAVSAAAALVDAMRGKGDDDDDENFWETWYRNFLENFIGFGSNSDPLSMILFVKDIENLFIQAMDGNIFGGTSNMAFEGWWKLAQGTAEFKKVVSGDESVMEWLFGDPDKNTPGKFLSGLGYVTGYPTYTFVKDVKSFFHKLGINVYASDVSADESEGEGTEIKSKWYDYESNPIDVPDGSALDNLLNKFGFNLTEAEKSEREYQANLKEYSNKVKNLTGEEKEKKIRSLAMAGYKDSIANGDYAAIKSMRRMVSDLGGDVDDFDERIETATKTAYKKCIGDDTQYSQMQEMRNYLLDKGWSEYKISNEIIYKSDAAKDFKAACRTMDHDAMVDALVPLMEAGITESDIYKLYKNRNMGSYDKSTTGNLIWATEGTITSTFGYRGYVTAGASSYHQGIDIGAALGTNVVASDGGTVIFTGYDADGYGNYIRVQHDNGVITQYAHLDYIGVKKGQTVGQGQYIGNVGSTGCSTGPHLDFRVEINGSFVDPMQYLQ